MTRKVGEWLRCHWLDVAVFGVYGIVTIVMTWPLVRQLDSHLPGPGDDLLVHYWNGWRTKQVLTQGGDLYYTDLIFYPQGVSLVYHNISWANIALWLLLEFLAGGVAAFNLVYMLNLTLCGVGMYVLMRYLAKQSTAQGGFATPGPETAPVTSNQPLLRTCQPTNIGAALIAGLVYAFWPYRMFEIDHPNLIVTQWLPLFLLYLIRVVREEGKIRHATIAAVFLILTGYARWQLLVFAALVAVLYVLYSLLFERQYWNTHVVAPLVVTVAISAVAMAPPLYPMIRDQLAGEGVEAVFVESGITRQTDLLAYVVPPRYHLLGGLFEGLKYAAAFERAWYSNAYLGCIVVFLAIAGVRRARRLVWFWAGLALVSWLLALGPALRFNGHVYSSVTLPYTLVEGFLPIRIMRAPRRFNVLLALPVAAMAGYGVLVLRDHVHRLNSKRFLSIALFVLLALLVCLDYLQVPVRTFDADVSPFYQSLAAEPDRFALLNLPTGRTKSGYCMFCQTIHGKPIVEGSVARPPREAEEFVDNNPFLAYLRENRMTDPTLPDVSRQLDILAEADIRYIIMHKRYAFPWEKADWRTYFAYHPVYEDRFISVYRTDPQVGRDFDLSQELYSGLGLVRVISSTNFISPASLMEVAVVWGTTEPQNEDWAVELALVDEAGQHQQTVAFSLVPGWPTGQWPASALAHGSYAFMVDPRLPGGLYALTLALTRPDTGERIGESVVIDALEMPARPRVFTRPPVQVETDVVFGDVLRLLGYDLEIVADAVHITLHWQALRRMEVAYKMFAHLFDPESGELMAQADVMPKDWGYPTNWWEVGEVVSDEIPLPLTGVPLGAYRLAIGAYDPVSLERLPIHTADDQILSMGQVVLEETIYVSVAGGQEE